MNWFRQNGKIIKVDGKIATGELCCCPGDDLCCCPQFVDPFPTMKFELAGFITGRVTGIDGAPGLGTCVEWTADNIPLDLPSYCFDEIQDTFVGAVMVCEDGNFLVAGIEFNPNLCQFSVLTPVSLDCDHLGSGKFRGVWDWTIEPAPSATCPCLGETGQLIITEE